MSTDNNTPYTIIVSVCFALFAICFALGVVFLPMNTANLLRTVADYISPKAIHLVETKSPIEESSYQLKQGHQSDSIETHANALRTVTRPKLTPPDQPENASDADVEVPHIETAKLPQLRSETEWINIKILGRQSGGHSGSIIVPVRLFNGDRVVSARMLFDTGATFTTLTRDVLSQLGASISSQSPRIVTQTANGQAERPLVTIDAVALGMAEVRTGLTIGVCDDCGSGEIAGLLGLNFSRHFRVMVDHERGELKLAPKFIEPSNVYDIRPFLDLKASRAQRRAEKFEIDVQVHNRSDREIVDATISAVIGKRERRLTKEVPAIPAGHRMIVPISGKLWVEDPVYRLELSHATW